MKHLVLLLSLAALAASSCKKETPIGRGFALEQPLQLKAEPAESSAVGTTLPVGSEFELISRSVADTKGNGTWLKIRAGKQVGFMRPDAAESNNRLAVILMLDSATAEKYVTNKQVQVLAQPLQKSAVIATLPSGANVEGVSHSQHSTQIEGVHAHWVGVKTGEQKVGYVFGGYLDKVATQAEGSGANTSTQHVDGQSIGYAMIISETPTFRPGHKPLLDDIPEERVQRILKDIKWPPAKGQIVHVKNMKKTGKKIMYEIYGAVVDTGGFRDLIYTQTLWVSNSDAEFFTNVFNYTLKMNPTIPAEMVDFLSKEASYLDAPTIKIEPLKLSKVAEPGIRYFFMSGQVAAIPGWQAEQFLVMQRGTKLQLLEKIAEPSWVRVVDIDGDGRAEFIFYSMDRSGARSASVHVYETGNGFQSIMRLGVADFAVEPPYLVVHCGYSDSQEWAAYVEYDDQCLHLFKLENGKVVEMPLTEKYQKRDAELRAKKSE